VREAGYNYTCCFDNRDDDLFINFNFNFHVGKFKSRSADNAPAFLLPVYKSISTGEYLAAAQLFLFPFTLWLCVAVYT
jgi:hypothetical protein